MDLHTPEPELRRWAAELLRRARGTVHGLDDAQVVEIQVCVRPMPVDGQSIVGRLPGAPGLYVAVTHSGVTLAAHLSRLIAADLTTGTPPAPLTPYNPARFTARPLKFRWPRLPNDRRLRHARSQRQPAGHGRMTPAPGPARPAPVPRVPPAASSSRSAS